MSCSGGSRLEMFSPTRYAWSTISVASRLDTLLKSPPSDADRMLLDLNFNVSSTKACSRVKPAPSNAVPTKMTASLAPGSNTLNLFWPTHNYFDAKGNNKNAAKILVKLECIEIMHFDAHKRGIHFHLLVFNTFLLNERNCQTPKCMVTFSATS